MAKKEDNTNTLIIIAFVLAVAVGGYFYLRSKKPKDEEILKDVFDNLTFETSKSIIKDSSFPYLDDLVIVLKKKPTWQLQIVGHTDEQGSEQINLTLSKKRAEAVKEYLIKSGVQNAIFTDGFGESKPIADNKTPEGREKNRRVEFSIIKYQNPYPTIAKK